MKTRLLLVLCSILLWACAKKQSSEKTLQLTEAETRMPENALKGLSVGEGIEAQLFAAEPMVRNPSNMDIDHRGRLWVVENVNYRPKNNPDNPYQEGGDMVVILEDTDGDGQADDRKIFFQDLLVDGAMGIGVFDNQVYLSSSPHILVLTDDDRDDIADRVDTLFTGMGSKQGDHTVHAASLGPDGRLYFNFGNAGSKMLYKNGSPVIDKMGNEIKASGRPYQQGMVFRAEMDGSNVEVLGHNFRNNYEVCVDSYGRMWQSDNDDDGNKSVRLNYVMEYGNFGYRDEFTQDAWQVSRSGMHPEIPSRHWHQNDPGVIPNLYILGSGSPCGITFYEGDLLPEIYHNQLMHADAGPGTLRAFPIEDSGAGFSASELPMLMRKADAWYRPTDVAVAPDGSVFASDWYDPGVGGHWAGDAKQGRIYRITVPEKKDYTIPQYSFSTAEKATEALKSPNSATRYLAWQTLNNLGEGAEGELLKLWESSNSIYRARALWLLARIDSNHIEQALDDEDVLIRATAIRVARQLIPEKLIPLLQKKATDSSAKVRREVAIALREIEDEAVSSIWAELAAQHDGKDRWYLEALGIGAMNRWDECFEAWMEKINGEWDTPVMHDIIWRSRASQTFDYLISLLQKPQVAAQNQARYLRSIDFINAIGKNEALANLLSVERQDQAIFNRMLLTHISVDYARNSEEVKEAVLDLLPDLRGGKEYLDLVSKLQLEEELSQVFHMAIAQPNKELGVSAAHVVLQLDSWKIFQDSSDAYKHREAIIPLARNINQGPAKEILRSIILDTEEEMAIRKKALEALAFDWGWERRLIDLLENENMPEKLVKSAASHLLTAARPVDRAEGMKYLDDLGETTQIASLQVLMQKEGDMTLGKQAFSTYCLTCHQVGEEGIEFGPDLSEIANKLGKDALYSAILYPSAAISHGFEGVHFELKDGSHQIGYVLSENDQKVDLKVQSGTRISISKTDIAKKEVLEQSLMTAGLGQAMGEETLVNIVSYLSTLSNQQTMASNPFQGQIGYERDK